MLLSLYAAVALAVAAAAFLVAEWVREPGGTAPDRPGALAIVAGLLWPVLAVGLMQWVLIAALASRVRNPATSAGEPGIAPGPVRIDAKP